MARRVMPRLRVTYAVEGESVVRRGLLGGIREAHRDEVAEVAWVVDDGTMTDQAYLLLAAQDRGLVAVPGEELASSGVHDWCKTLPGWDFERLAAVQAEVGDSYRTLWERQN